MAVSHYGAVAAPTFLTPYRDKSPVVGSRDGPRISSYHVSYHEGRSSVKAGYILVPLSTILNGVTILYAAIACISLMFVPPP
jgi:hypothetical protein